VPPVVVAASRFASALETGTAKLWMLLVGVNHYVDLTLPSLRYAAGDCQGIGTSLSAATQAFPHKELSIYHDFAAELPTVTTVTASLSRIVAEARSQDTVLIYFSGHGVLEPVTQQTVLCLRDTDCRNLLSTGLQIQSVLQQLQNCAAHDRLLWLDACHSGNLSFMGTPSDRAIAIKLNPTAQLVESLRQGASQGRGFYALLSCDEGQQSWEFPDLGHGVFSYYLMRGLRGEAADERGIIDADGLYRYVYRQTVQYIDTLNHQLRVADREQRDRGEISWYPEYSPQTPKRIVAGVGEIVLGIQQSSALVETDDRRALLVDLMADPSSDALGRVLQAEGKFTVDAVLNDSGLVANISDRIQTFLAGESGGEVSRSEYRSISTRLLYLRGKITELEGDDVGLELSEGITLSRNWLSQVLQHNIHTQQIVILDCLVPNEAPPDAHLAADWVTALNSTTVSGINVSAARLSQWMMVCIAPLEDAEVFAQVLLEATISTPLQSGASVGNWLVIAQTNLAELGICSMLWRSDSQPQEILAPTMVVDPVAHPHQLATESKIEALATAGEPTLLDLETADIESTARQDTTQIQSVVAATVFSEDLAALLHRSFGPIAASLLARFELARVADPAMAIEILLPLLPERERDNFARQVATLGERQPQHLAPVAQSQVPLPTTSATPTAKTSPPTLVATPQIHFSEAARSEIEIALRGIVGPVASVLLGQIEPTAWRTDRSLIAALTPYLTADLIDRFARQLQQIVHSSTNASVEPESGSTLSANGRGIESAPAPVILDDDFIIACERELTLAIGPIAKFIVANTYQAHPQLSATDFAAILAEQISDPDRAASFLRHLNLH
jgi:uncharacterized caspase-like protein